MVIHLEMAIEHIQKYYVNKAFVGVNGISLEHDLTAKLEYKSSLTNTMIENSQK
ncbi:MAG: DeoR family fructose operon transcriptional repressor [Psychromonas sp.]|jgi:DeoR family fructose operon transcriptional repressor